MLLLLVPLPATAYKIHFVIPFIDLLSHINYPEGLRETILRHVLSWSVQPPGSLIPKLISLQWITEGNENTPQLAELIWLTHYPTQRRVPRGWLAETLDPAVEGVGNPPFPVIQQSLYGQLRPRGAPRWLQLHRERKISAQGPFSSMGEL